MYKVDGELLNMESAEGDDVEEIKRQIDSFFKEHQGEKCRVNIKEDDKHNAQIQAFDLTIYDYEFKDHNRHWFDQTHDLMIINPTNLNHGTRLDLDFTANKDNISIFIDEATDEPMAIIEVGNVSIYFDL